jgi:NAD+ synthase (glutamine-hydrolysing)
MPQQLIVVMAQLNLLVGDITGNTQKILAAARHAQQDLGAGLIAFPELALTGYPPEDLLLRPSLELRVDKALQSILEADLDIYMAVGLPLQVNGALYNALSLIKGTQVLANYCKQSLPNYQVFDERRYFHAGHSPCIVDIAGLRVALTICEDMWDEGPTLQAAHAGAQLIVNINASPYHQDKILERTDLLACRARQAGAPIVYTNMVGGQDELVFDGSSMVVSAQGDVQVRASSFTEECVPVHLEMGDDGVLVCTTMNSIAPLDTTEQGVYKALVMGVRDYVSKNGFKGVVLGLSGGIDSALTLAIAVDALGQDKVHAVMMPFEYTSQLSQDLAQEQAITLGVHYSVIPIGEAYQSFTSALSAEFAGLPVDVTEQNIQARCRGVILMAISNKTGKLVLTTGNKSEVAVGYCTLYGDMAGGFDVLKDVAKTMVYRLSKYRNAQPDAREIPIIPKQVIERAPTAELAPGQIDQDSLPAYEELDAILALYVERDQSAEQIIAQGYPAATVHHVLSLVDRNEYKRRQSPVGVRLTQRGFGRDRRYPITSGWDLGE